MNYIIQKCIFMIIHSRIVRFKYLKSNILLKFAAYSLKLIEAPLL